MAASLAWGNNTVTILSPRMIEDSGKRGNTMAERRQLFAEMSKYRTFKEHPIVSVEYSQKDWR